MPDGFEITGDQEVIEKLESFNQKAFQAVIQAMGEIQLDEVGEARKIVPKLTGRLEASIVNLPLAVKAITGGAIIEGVVAAQMPYAEYQHENVLDHSKSKIRPDAKDHYLSGPSKKNASKYARLFADAIKAALK